VKPLLFGTILATMLGVTAVAAEEPIDLTKPVGSPDATSAPQDSGPIDLTPRQKAKSVAAPPVPLPKPSVPAAVAEPPARSSETGSIDTAPAVPDTGLQSLPLPEEILPSATGPGQAPAVTATEPSVASLSDGSADLAYGAFQRGFYLTAFSLAIQRAEQGDTAAKTLLGLIYEGGYGMPRDYAAALSWYGLAADKGDRQALYALGLMYLDGRGVAVDRERAAAYLARAANAGEIEAMYRLAKLHFDDHVGGIDDRKAIDLLTRAAEAGNADAQYALGDAYATGKGVARDEAAANRWFISAAKAGQIDAEVEYAIRLFNGTGMQKDEAAAAVWFERAADLGNPVAQNRLARILSAGRGMPADPVAAAKWHLLARAAGRHDDFLDSFVNGLTEQQRAEATSAAQRWPAR
jgi:TPR repeat protein